MILDKIWLCGKLTSVITVYKMSKLLELVNLSSGYGTSQVLNKLNFYLEINQVVCLLGRNGVGKSTTIKSICGMIDSRSGSIKFKNYELTNKSSFQAAKLGIGLVPEGRRIFSNLTVMENLLVAHKDGYWSTIEIFKLFPVLSERCDHLAINLSGGEQQMLAIARALMTNPELLILDEATEGLAPKIRKVIWETLVKLKEKGMSILIVDKMSRELMEIVDFCLLMQRGQIVWKGFSDELSDDIISRYLTI